MYRFTGTGQLNIGKDWKKHTEFTGQLKEKHNETTSVNRKKVNWTQMIKKLSMNPSWPSGTFSEIYGTSGQKG